MNYTSLEQRMAHTYRDMFPPFIPLAGAEASIQSQEQFYGFMKNVIQILFDTPQVLFTKLFEDDAYPNRFNQASYGKPNLYGHMKKDLVAIDELMTLLFTLGQKGTVEDGGLALSQAVEIKKKHRNVLPQLGLKLEDNILKCDQFSDLFTTWHWMATRENASPIAFSRCMFDPGHSYIQDIYARLFGDENAFCLLEQYLDKNGYMRVETKRGPFTLDYVKQTVEKEVPLGSPQHGDPFHYGISAEYKASAAIPQFMVLRIVEMSDMLLKFDRMPDGLKRFVVQYIKKCDDCKYCIQTDKTGKRKQLHIDLAYDGGYLVCPLYPGFNFCFTELNDNLVQGLTAFLDFMDLHITSAG